MTDKLEITTMQGRLQESINLYRDLFESGVDGHPCPYINDCRFYESGDIVCVEDPSMCERHNGRGEI